jgi:Holliday junction resolvase RusA-like endonuclease
MTDVAWKVEFVVPGEPKSKSRHRTGLRGGKVFHYKDQATGKAQDAVGVHYRAAAGPHSLAENQGYGVMMNFYVGQRQRRDVDNFVKLVLDGLTGHAWKDDSQVTEIHARIIHESDNPHSAVRVYETDDLPDWKVMTCQQCQREFRTYSSWSKTRKYCSRECAYAKVRAKNRRTCARCGKSFQSRYEAQYCTKTCARRHP